MAHIIFLVLAYGLGGLPFGLWVAKRVRGIDIREHGSRNTGATNVFRVVGKKWGFLVLFLDALKGYLAVCVPGWLLGAEAVAGWRLAFGVTAILGHSFSLFLKFKGGKGVATSLGVFLGLAWLPTLLTFALWSAVFAVSHIISVASLSAALFFPVLVLLTYRGQADFSGMMTVSVLLTVFIFYTHRANIQRLRRGEEKRLF